MSDQKLDAIMTGLLGFDAEYGGLKPGQLIILAGTTSVGKSALGLQIAEHIATGQNVIIFSLEMSVEEVTERRIKRAGESAEKIKESNLYVSDSAVSSVEEIYREARILKQREGLGLIVVDYLQLMRCDAIDSSASQECRRDGLTRGLKCLARDLEVPILVVSQLHREAIEANDHMLDHFWESRAIRRDADVVMFIHRRTDSEDDMCNLIIAKHQSGRLQSFGMKFDAPRHEFTETDWGTGQDFEVNDFTNFPASDGVGPMSYADATSCD